VCAAVAVALAVPALAGAGRQTLLPGVTYERSVVVKGGRPVVLHIVRTPPPSGLYRVRPYLSHGTVLGRQAVPGMQGRIGPRATTVGVNGDFFNLATGESSGLFLRGGVLSSPPSVNRSAVAVGADGLLAVDLFRLVGSWRAGTSGARPLRRVNRMVTSPPGLALFTRAWGGPTPKVRGAAEVVLTGFPAAKVGVDLTGTVGAVTNGGGTPIPKGGAVLQARGDIRTTLLAAAPVGAVVTIRLGLAAFPDGSLDAIGGGPVLVKDGVPVQQSGENFSADQLDHRHPRTAVGQLADGSYLFVVAEGRSSQSAGVKMWGLAQTMAELGAVTAINFDGGGSSTLSFDGRVLNVPSDGRPRRVANGLFLYYYGIYAPPLPGGVLSPNGDGVGESKLLTARIARRAAVHLQLLRPDGSEAWSFEEVVGTGVLTHLVSRKGLPEGIWRWVAEARDDASGETSRMVRTFKVNRTIGHLRLSRAPVRVRPPVAGRLGISVRLTRPARLDVAILGTDGKVRRTVYAGEAVPGSKQWRWNGRTRSGRIVPPGKYVVRVRARNELGAVSLRKPVRVLLAPSR
jgi:Phosphodiester glycosidase